MSPTSRALLAAALLLPAIARPGTAAAQPSAALDVTVGSSYVDRGLTLTNRPVVQPELSLAWASARGTLSGGAWGNVEPARYDGARHISVVEGRGPDLTEVQLWAEYARAVRGVELAVGATQMLYPNTAGVTAASNTTELHAAATLPAPLSPTVALFWDVGTVRGAYAEVALSHERALRGGRALTLGASAGVNVGQGPDATGRDEAAFERRGLTHLDLSARLALPAGRLVLEPAAHLLLGRDPLTRVVAPGRERGAKGWVGVRVGWSHGGDGS